MEKYLIKSGFPNLGYYYKPIIKPKDIENITLQILLTVSVLNQYNIFITIHDITIYDDPYYYVYLVGNKQFNIYQKFRVVPRYTISKFNIFKIKIINNFNLNRFARERRILYYIPPTLIHNHNCLSVTNYYKLNLYQAKLLSIMNIDFRNFLYKGNYETRYEPYFELEIQDFQEKLNIEIAPLNITNVPDLAKIGSKPEIYKYIGKGDQPWNVNYLTNIVEENNKDLIKRHYHFIILYKSVIIGYVGIRPYGKHSQVRYFIDPEKRGKGYMVHALRLLIIFLRRNKILDILYAVVNPDNIPSIKIVYECGFNKNYPIKLGNKLYNLYSYKI